MSSSKLFRALEIILAHGNWMNEDTYNVRILRNISQITGVHCQAEPKLHAAPAVAAYCSSSVQATYNTLALLQVAQVLLWPLTRHTVTELHFPLHACVHTLHTGTGGGRGL
jgi:hypothetical protein